jgi:hypothetical protein
MPVYYPTEHPRSPDRLPTSREINQAIEVLRDAGMMDSIMRTIDLWNAERLVSASQRVGTHEELSNLFVGLRPIEPRRPPEDTMPEGAWS